MQLCRACSYTVYALAVETVSSRRDDQPSNLQWENVAIVERLSHFLDMQLLVAKRTRHLKRKEMSCFEREQVPVGSLTWFFRINYFTFIYFIFIYFICHFSLSLSPPPRLDGEYLLEFVCDKRARDTSEEFLDATRSVCRIRNWSRAYDT